MIENTIKHAPINRREFLYYLWGASALVLAAGTCGGLASMAAPRQTAMEKEMEGLVTFSPDQIPPVTLSAPIPVNKGYFSFWLSNVDSGLYALSAQCTKDGVYFKWRPQGGPGHEFPHFICPACSSQFTNEGVVITGIAARNLDMYAIEVTTPTGVLHTPPDGGPVSVQNATQIVVNIYKKIYGKPHPGKAQYNLNSNHIFGP